MTSAHLLPKFRPALVALLGAAVWVTLATAQTPSAADIDRWIGELGDNSYTVRQAAAEQLTAGGDAARAALDKVADSPDPEIRFAARRLVRLIDQTEFDHRLAEFAADVDGHRGVMLPGWKEFGELVGRDVAARALFVTMQRDEAALLQRMFGHPGGAGDMAWEQHLARSMRWRVVGQQGGFVAPLGSCATMLFLGAMPDVKMSDNVASSLTQLAQLPVMREAMAADRAENAVRRLVGAWVVGCPSRSAQVLRQRLDLMLQYQLAEALPMALAVAQRRPKYALVHPTQQVMAVLAVAKFGSANDVSALEPLLDDRTVYLPQPQVNGPPGHVHSVQVRDVALAALLHLTDQEPLTYGFLHARPHPQMVFDPTSLGLENDERREAAADQWRTWRGARRDATPPQSASS